MTITRSAYLNAAYPRPLKQPDLRDEDVAYLLDKAEKRSKAARKAQETRCKKRTEKASAE